MNNNNQNKSNTIFVSLHFYADFVTTLRVIIFVQQEKFQYVPAEKNSLATNVKIILIYLSSGVRNTKSLMS